MRAGVLFLTANELLEETVVQSTPSLALVPGPTWNSFEQFRRGGQSVLDEIPVHGVGTLRGKSGTFRVLRDEDFQRLLGLSSDIHRLQNGLNFVIQAARVVARHPDQEHVQLLIQSASMVAGSPVLPVREGHESFELSAEEQATQSADEFELETA